MAHDEMMNVQQVAEALGVRVETIHKMRVAGKGPLGHRRGARLVFRAADVEAFLERERGRTLRGEGLPE
ncbi:helix-turn-helix domain-containing protein [Mycolicibacterium palauense]|uniref:helix-turn-helix domain-containing protein n=1 Tax=Mycolicibacterium palauense TaxID=2034511 RepID=UPI000BFED572|nr:helix-turn-helix domain-containing protein [Mycolicibacterium palauense]